MRPAVLAGATISGLALCCAALVLRAAVQPAGDAAPAAPAAAAASTAVRIVTLAPHITELVFAAGAGDKIVATVLSSDYPPAARDIPRVGNGLEVSVERILAFQPSAVMTWQPQGAAQALAPSLSRLHIPLVHSRPASLRDIPDEIIRYGELFHTQGQAQAAAESLTQRLDALARKYTQKAPVSVFIEVGTSPLYTIGSDPLLNDALRLCGGVNIYAGSSVAAPQVSVENILLQRPDVVITPARSQGALDEARERWAGLQLPAALHGHVYMIDPDALFRPGPRLIDATETLCRALDQTR